MSHGRTKISLMVRIALGTLYPNIGGRCLNGLFELGWEEGWYDNP